MCIRDSPNLRGESVDAGRYRWSVDVPANGETELRFTVDQPVP